MVLGSWVGETQLFQPLVYFAGSCMEGTTLCSLRVKLPFLKQIAGTWWWMQRVPPSAFIQPCVLPLTTRWHCLLNRNNKGLVAKGEQRDAQGRFSVIMACLDEQEFSNTPFFVRADAVFCMVVLVFFSHLGFGELLGV